jgi:GMP synthase (glutamine-hydrolysing)
MATEKIIILDFGSQYTQLIARKVRECGVYAEIYPYNTSEDKIKELAPKGIILSGGPSSVYAEGAPIPSFDVFSIGVPVLGICYGLQLMAYQLGGQVDKAARREYGRAELTIDADDDLFAGVKSPTVVWMSHGDHLTEPPKGFETIAHSGNTDFCAIRSSDRKIFGVQFHPEKSQKIGLQILRNFVEKI